MMIYVIVIIVIARQMGALLSKRERSELYFNIHFTTFILVKTVTIFTPKMNKIKLIPQKK